MMPSPLQPRQCELCDAPTVHTTPELIASCDMLMPWGRVVRRCSAHRHDPPIIVMEDVQLFHYPYYG